MICEKCGVREANLRYIEVINGVKTEHNLCGECAREVGIGVMNGSIASALSGDDPISKMLSGLFGSANETQPQKKEEWDHVICPHCHTTYNEFIERGRFGCPDCCSVFDLLMKGNMKRLQEGDTHTGKRPRFGLPRQAKEQEAPTPVALNLGEELEILQARLSEAIREEEFEDAAAYRDQIRALKERMASEHEVV